MAIGKNEKQSHNKIIVVTNKQEIIVNEQRNNQTSCFPYFLRSIVKKVKRVFPDHQKGTRSSQFLESLSRHEIIYPDSTWFKPLCIAELNDMLNFHTCF